MDLSLQEYARAEFEIDNESLTIDETRRAIEELQKQNREREFFLLEELRPQKVVDQQLLDTFSSAKIQGLLKDTEPVIIAYENAKVATDKIGDAQVAIAKALDDFIKSGISINSTDSQTCPFCEYSDIATLTQPRISEIRSWQPIQKIEQETKNNVNSKLNELKSLISGLIASKNGLIPNLPTTESWEMAIKDKSANISLAAMSCRDVLMACRDQTSEFDIITTNILTLIKQNSVSDSIESLKSEIIKLQTALPIVIDKAQEYSDSFHALETVIGKQSREDPLYNMRQIWLSICQKRDDLLADFEWEKAKKNAQKELENLRDTLVVLREKLIEARRIAFSDGMTNIWTKLRSDRYSTFSRLFIPPAKGKGLPLEIEVKAELDDGVQKKEVDALRVFSESQINILGIAAFSVRSKLLGHKTIILDDPVQSMDEDHFKTFCTQLLPELLIGDGQVIILTHNDAFAREISYSFIEHENYVTMKVRHSRRTGCVIEEGNRRICERLKKAEKLCEEGSVEDAWLTIRKAIERLYLISYIKYGPSSFNPLSWIDQTAEYMWDDRQGGGVGSILEKKIPGIGKRLKEILTMTAAGAHDKHAKGKTDIDNAIKDLKNIVATMKLGSG